MARRPQDEYRRDFTVTEPRAHPGGYTEYKVTATFVSKTTPDDVKEVVVWKRYSELKRLHGDLALLHRHLFRRLEEFPPFPRGHVFGRFEAEVIEERRRAAEALLCFAARIPALCNSPQLRDFLRGGEVRRPLDPCELPPLPPPLIPVPCEPREQPPGPGEPGPPSPAEEAAEEEEEEEEEENTEAREQTEAGPPPAAAAPPAAALSPEELALFDPVLAGGPAAAAGGGPGGGYVAAATAEVRRALELEAAGDPPGALGCYRRAVRALLHGLPDDPDPARRAAVSRRTAQYLRRAEELAAAPPGGGP